jgi:glutathione S-transferase
LVHGEKWVTDSWAIVRYLDEAFPNTPRLTGTGAETALLQFFQNWAQTTIHAGLARLIMQDLHRSLLPTDQAYFRESRERIFKMSIEEVQAGREERVAAFLKSLQPMRQSLQAQPFLGGTQPSYADYLAFGGFQWARISSPFAVLDADDVVHTWFERCLDLHDGLGRREAASAT